MKDDSGPSPAAPSYGVVARLLALRDALAAGPRSFTELAAAMPEHYADDARSRRRLRRDLENLRQIGLTVAHQDRPILLPSTARPPV